MIPYIPGSANCFQSVQLGVAIISLSFINVFVVVAFPLKIIYRITGVLLLNLWGFAIKAVPRGSFPSTNSSQQHIIISSLLTPCWTSGQLAGCGVSKCSSPSIFPIILPSLNQNILSTTGPSPQGSEPFHARLHVHRAVCQDLNPGSGSSRSQQHRQWDTPDSDHAVGSLGAT